MVQTWVSNRGLLCLRHGVFFTDQGSMEAHFNAARPCDVFVTQRLTAAGSVASAGTVAAPMASLRTLGSGQHAATPMDTTLLANAALGSVNVTLPVPSAMRGRLLTVKKVDATGNQVRLLGNLEGTQRTVIGMPGMSLTVLGQGSAYRVV